MYILYWYPLDRGFSWDSLPALFDIIQARGIVFISYRLKRNICIDYGWTGYQVTGYLAWQILFSNVEEQRYSGYPFRPKYLQYALFMRTLYFFIYLYTIELKAIKIINKKCIFIILSLI